MLTKTLKAEGRTIYYFDNEDRRVIHNFDGPAIIYDDKTKDEYWLYGKQMTKEDLSKLIDECCDDIFDRKEPLANVKARLYYTLKKHLTLINKQ